LVIPQAPLRDVLVFTAEMMLEPNSQSRVIECEASVSVSRFHNGISSHQLAMAAGTQCTVGNGGGGEGHSEMAQKAQVKDDKGMHMHAD
jgi:hypothetical protein